MCARRQLGGAGGAARHVGGRRLAEGARGARRRRADLDDARLRAARVGGQRGRALARARGGDLTRRHEARRPARAAGALAARRIARLRRAGELRRPAGAAGTVAAAAPGGRRAGRRRAPRRGPHGRACPPGRRRLRRTALVSLVPAGVVAALWLRLEQPRDHAAIVAAVLALALAPALVRPRRGARRRGCRRVRARRSACVRALAAPSGAFRHRARLALLGRLPRLLRREGAVRPPGARGHARGDPGRRLRVRTRPRPRGRREASARCDAHARARRRLARNPLRRAGCAGEGRRHPPRRARRSRRVDGEACSPHRDSGCGGACARRPRGVDVVRGREGRARRLAALGPHRDPAGAGERVLRVGRAVRGARLSPPAHDRAQDQGAAHVALLARSSARRLRRRPLAPGSGARRGRARARRPRATAPTGCASR